MKRITIALPDNTGIISLTILRTEQEGLRVAVDVASNCINVKQYNHISYDGKYWSTDETDNCGNS